MVLVELMEVIMEEQVVMVQVVVVVRGITTHPQVLVVAVVVAGLA
jgi:hypothetical protein